VSVAVGVSVTGATTAQAEAPNSTTTPKTTATNLDKCAIKKLRQTLQKKNGHQFDFYSIGPWAWCVKFI
jgi:hypothetical protein